MNSSEIASHIVEDLILDIFEIGDSKIQSIMVPIINIFVALNKIGAINLFGPLLLFSPNLNHKDR